MVGARALDVALAVFHAAPEVAAADDHAHLDAHGHTLFNDVSHFAHHFKIQAEMLVARQGLTADL